MFLEKLFGLDREEVSSESLVWEPVQINDGGVSVKWEKNDGEIVQMTCTAVYESSTRFMLEWKDDEKRKFFIGKEEIVSIEVQ